MSLNLHADQQLLPEESSSDKKRSINRCLIGASGALVLYFILSGLMFGMQWPSRTVLLGSGGDPDLAAWFLGWVAHSITTLTNPFVSNYMNIPRGVNLAQNAEAPFLGVLLFPFTYLLGPIFSLNMAFLLSPALTAFSAYALATWMKMKYSAALVTGLLFGFSPYMVGQSLGHLNLIFNPFVPIVFVGCYRLVYRIGSWWKNGLLLGVCLLLFFYVSPELVIDQLLIICSLMALYLLWGYFRKHIHRRDLAGALLGLMISGVILFVGGAAQIFEFLRGPYRYTGTPQPTDNVYHSSVASILHPSVITRFAPLGTPLASASVPGNVSEDGSYIGLIMFMAFLCGGAVILILGSDLARRALRWFAAVFVVSILLQIGPSLQVAGSTVSFLPFRYLHLVPIVRNVLPIRFSLFTDFAIALTLGLALDVLIGYVDLSRSWPRVLSAVTLLALLAAGFTWWPAFPRSEQPALSAARVASMVDRPVLSGDAVLTYPLPGPQSGQALLWQAESRFSFRLFGSYAAIAGPQGLPLAVTYPVAPLDVEVFLSSMFDELSYVGVPPVATVVTAQLRADLRAFIAQQDIRMVLFQTSGLHWRSVLTLFRQSFGRATSRSGDVYLWIIPRRGSGG